MAKIDESSQMYVYFKKAKGSTFPLLKLNEKYRCEKNVDYTYEGHRITIRVFITYYDTTYYHVTLERFEEHFLTIKQYRKLKLKKILNINEK